MEEIEIFEQLLFSKDNQGINQEVGKMAILRGGIGTPNPKAVMNDAVSKYVKDKTYNQYIEIHLDNPWVRVIINGFNDIQYEPFKDQHL